MSALVALAALVPMEAQAGPIQSSPSSGSTLNFGNVLVGSTSGPLDVTVTQTGNQTQLTNRTVTSTLGGTGAAMFSQNVDTRTLTAASPQNSFTYSFTPTSTGAQAATATLTAPQLNPPGQNPAFSSTINLTGTGVAPVANLSTSQDIGNVRLGTTGTGEVLIQNNGNGNLSGLGAISNLNVTSITASNGPLFSVAAPGTASLIDGASTSRSVSFGPAARGEQSTTITAGFSNGIGTTNLSGNLTTTLSGRGVGPEFSASASALDFGTLNQGDLTSLVLTISNITTDGDLGSLTDLSILSVSIGGEDAALFDFLGATTGVISAGGSLELTLTFGGALAAAGNYNALLTIFTDQGVAFGAQGGDVFTVNLSGVIEAAQATAVPEPMTLALFGAGLLGLAAARRARRREG